MKIETLLSGDGSSTLYLPELDETYHSRHGAITESQYVYIEQGLAACRGPEIGILEFGFGTGLNALLSLRFAEKHKLVLNYCSVEKFPLPAEVIGEINYAGELKMEEAWKEMHALPWGKASSWASSHRLHKYEGDFMDAPVDNATIDLIYYDAFGPGKQPEVWQVSYLQFAFDALKKGGILVTYCAQGQFKRNLRALGFEVSTLKGPPGKLEMVFAQKKE